MTNRAKSDAIAGCFLTFAAMMKEDYGVDKAFAIKAIGVAYDLTESTPPRPDPCRALCRECKSNGRCQKAIQP